MERDLESWIDLLLRDQAVESGTEMEKIGEAFGKGFRRANPPTGYAGRRCRIAGGNPAKVYTIIGEAYDIGIPGKRWVDLDRGAGLPLCTSVADVLLLPWMADESDEVTP
jgi:hypothetical protein